jgi:hypothetical protein
MVVSSFWHPWEKVSSAPCTPLVSGSAAREVVADNARPIMAIKTDFFMIDLSFLWFVLRIVDGSSNASLPDLQFHQENL